jgi:hypothetical protein
MRTGRPTRLREDPYKAIFLQQDPTFLEFLEFF